jgi:hydrogenase maturation protein HypF
VKLARRHGLDTVALSGGVFQNVRFSDIVEDALVAQGLTVLVHHIVPPNDGGISVGQAAIAAVGSRPS